MISGGAAPCGTVMRSSRSVGCSGQIGFFFGDEFGVLHIARHDHARGDRLQRERGSESCSCRRAGRSAASRARVCARPASWDGAASMRRPRRAVCAPMRNQESWGSFVYFLRGGKG